MTAPQKLEESAGLATSAAHGNTSTAASLRAAPPETVDGATVSAPTPGAPIVALSGVPLPGVALSGVSRSGGLPSLPGYVIERELGRGGMGVVYLARHVQLNRPVALKMVLAGSFASDEQRLRFLIEAEMAARIKHPNITQVYEIGTFDTRPYYALEYVAGGSLGDAWRKGGHAPRDGAAMVEKLARAVQAAHAQGIIHRDLKPANVLLELDGTPKIADFGLAKKMDSGDVTMTGSAAVLGTPKYMAPEQALGQSKDVGPATDVYGLGAILYEALTGRPPFKGANVLETLEQVRTHEPTPPSRVRRDVPRDLEWICLKCLRKEPQDRYSTAAELADDLRRFAEDRPIAARPAGRFERAWRWCRRNRAIAMLSAALLLSLAAGMSVSVWQAVRATHERDQKELARQAESDARQSEALRADAEAAAKQEAEEQRDVAVAVRTFLQRDLLIQADPVKQANRFAVAGGLGFEVKENPTIRELLDRSAAELTPERIEVKFPKRPLVQAEILGTVGDAYRGIGAYEQAIAHLTRSRDLYLTRLGPDDLTTLDTEKMLAWAYVAAGHGPQAIELLEQVRDKRAKQPGLDELESLVVLHCLGSAYLQAGRTSDAIRELEHVRDAMTAMLGPNDARVLSTLNSLAWAYQTVGRADEATALFERVYEGMLRELGPDHPDTLTVKCNLATIYVQAGRTADAIPLLEHIRNEKLPLMGGGHPGVLNVLNNLALAYKSVGRIAEAITLYQEVRDQKLAILGSEHPDTLATLNNLAAAYQAAGRSSEAIELLEPLRDQLLKMFGPDHPNTLKTMNNLASAYQSSGRTSEAVELFERAYGQLGKTLGFDHVNTMSTAQRLAAVFDEAGQFGRAEQLLREVVERLRKQKGPESTAVAGLLSALASNLLKQEKAVEAESVARESLTIREKLEPDAWTTASTRSLLGGCLLAQQKYAEAEPLLVAGYEGLKRHEATIPPQARFRLKEAVERLIRLYDALDKADDAANWRMMLETVDRE
jgi:tetratricopeptide (TPR) repeat protein/predicted Ser/Thr protein kinase